MRGETATSADLGRSSNYSNKFASFHACLIGSEVLKVVVEKVSLRVALMQGSVSPKRVEKSNILSSYDRRKRESG